MNQFHETLQDVIRKRGAMDKLISDNGSTIISEIAKSILCMYVIDDWQSEPYHQHQNFAEQRYLTIKEWVNRVMDRTGAPPELWLLCLEYVVYLLNCISTPSLDNSTPFQSLTGQVADISALIHYCFYQPVFFKSYEDHYPSKSNEKHGYWVGIADSVGDTLTYKILDTETHKVVQ